MNVVAIFSALLLAVAGLAASSDTARACSCAPDALSRSNPEDGATDVPVDFAPVIHGYFDPAQVSWETAAGDPVEFTLTHGEGIEACAGYTGQLVAKQALEANTQYVIRLATIPDFAGDDQELHFTTGSAHVPVVALDAPELSASVIVGNFIGDSCASEVQGCVSASGATQYELRLVAANGDDAAWTISDGSDTFSLSAVPKCIEVRARDAAGRHSEPTALCGKQIPSRDALDSDYDGFVLHCEDGMIGERSVDQPAADGGTPGPDADAGDVLMAMPDTTTDDAGVTPTVTKARDASPNPEAESNCSATHAGSDANAYWLAPLALFTLLRARRRRSA